MRQAIEHFFEVSPDRPLHAGKVVHVLPEILVQLQRRGRHNSQCSRPAFRLLMQKPHVGGAECAGSLELNEMSHFLQIKSQGLGIDFQQPVLSTQ